MITVPFTKLHGAENDFLLTWRDRAPETGLSELARKICSRTTGIGADGWMLVWQETGGVATRLFNSDGSEPEISGNGTRCAAAFALIEEVASGPDILVATGAGPKRLRLLSRNRLHFLFEMEMGSPREEERFANMVLAGRTYDCTILNVGNPQCAIFVDEWPDEWQIAAAAAESHSRFPNRSNVSFVRLVDRHTIEAVFYVRGAGETRSSGTGSTGAAVAAILRGMVESPVEVRTPAGSLYLRWEDSVFLTGPAELIGEGRFFLNV